MKKNLITLTILAGLFILFAGKFSAEAAINLDKLKYKEITAEKFYLKSIEHWYSARNGYKIVDVFILGIEEKIQDNETVSLLKLASAENTRGWSVFATEFLEKKKQTDPTWTERVDYVKDNKRYNGRYTVYVYYEKDSPSKLILHDIDGIPTQERINALREEEETKRRAEEEKRLAEEKERLEKEKERLEKEEAERKAKEEKLAQEAAKRKAIEERIKPLVKGYVYHGMDEERNNQNLFNCGALEEGHAYYVPTLLLTAGGNMAGIMTIFGQPNYQLVSYISQKVRGEVVSSGITMFGPLPVSVVVIGGRIPTILGLAE